MENSLKLSQIHEKKHLVKGRRDALVYQSLYLINLLLLPVLSFLILLWLFFKYKERKGWQRIHLYRSMQLSIFAGFLIIIVPMFLLISTSAFEATLMVMAIYLVTIHTAFVLIGMLNLSRTMTKKLPLF